MKTGFTFQIGACMSEGDYDGSSIKEKGGAREKPTFIAFLPVFQLRPRAAYSNNRISLLDVNYFLLTLENIFAAGREKSWPGSSHGDLA
jgi:hypothetical protein